MKASRVRYDELYVGHLDTPRSQTVEFCKDLFAEPRQSGDQFTTRIEGIVAGRRDAAASLGESVISTSKELVQLESAGKVSPPLFNFLTDPRESAWIFHSSFKGLNYVGLAGAVFRGKTTSESLTLDLTTPDVRAHLFKVIGDLMANGGLDDFALVTLFFFWVQQPTSLLTLDWDGRITLEGDFDHVGEPLEAIERGVSVFKDFQLKTAAYMAPSFRALIHDNRELDDLYSGPAWSPRLTPQPS